jgi:hypothetical protein
MQAENICFFSSRGLRSPDNSHSKWLEDKN